MMREPEIERRLQELPSRGLSAGAEARIEAAMSRAAYPVNRTRPAPWWSLGVPLWLAAAACLAMCAATALVLRGLVGRGAPSLVAQRDAEEAGRHEVVTAPVSTASGLRTDIRRWKVLDVRTETPS